MNQTDFIQSGGGFETILFYAIAAGAIPLALGVLLDRAIIRSGFKLIGVFGAIAGLFLLLQAQFLALAQLMIYAVAITLLIVIALMLTNPRLESDFADGDHPQHVTGFLVALFLFFAVYLALRSESWPLSLNNVDPENVKVIGLALTTTYSLPFEFASVLLLAALMGSILLAKAETDKVDEIDELEESPPPRPPLVGAGKHSD